MTTVKHDWEGDPPKEPHLAFITDESGEATALPPGAYMLIVENPSKPDGVTPLVLVRVSKTRLTFKCACGQKGCTRDVRFNAVWRGHHPTKF